MSYFVGLKPESVGRCPVRGPAVGTLSFSFLISSLLNAARFLEVVTDQGIHTNTHMHIASSRAARIRLLQCGFHFLCHLLLGN